MRRFHAFEYVDGNVSVYMADEGENWRKVSEIDWLVMHRNGTRAIAESLEIKPALDDEELRRLTSELAMPRRH